MCKLKNKCLHDSFIPYYSRTVISKDLMLLLLHFLSSVIVYIIPLAKVEVLLKMTVTSFHKDKC